MGGKGGQSTNTVQNTAQTYNANPAISGIGSQAIQQAQAAGSQPFQMPVAPVAGFSQDQQAAFGNINNAQGMAQPYFNTAANYFSPQGAQSFLNPYAANVMAGMKDVFGQQRSGLEGNLVQSAGGVGADRIGVGQANLAHQQDLAAGQTLAGLYSDSARQAQAAGQGMGNLGMLSQNAALSGAQAQLQSGGLQQQLAQQQLNAPYQNQLARLAYPYQNAQFLAGITGGLAPAFGGSTYGDQNGRVTPPQPSALSQVLGVGAAGAGLYGSFGGFNGTGGSGKGSDAGTLNYGDLGGGTGGFTSGAYAEGGEVEEENNPHIPGITTDNGLMPIPYLPLQGGAGHSAPLTGGINFPQQQQQKPQDSGGGFGDVLKTAAQIIPFFLKDGGVAGYDEGGVTYSPDELVSSPLVERLAKNLQNFGQAQRPSGNPYAPPLTQKPQDPSFSDRFGAAFGAPAPSGPSAWDRFKGVVTPTAAAAPTAGEVNPSPVANGAIPVPRPYPGPGRLNAAETADAYRMPSPTAKGTDDEQVHIPANRETTPREVMRGMMPQASQPYPDALERNPGQVATRSPWMALVNAGATMAATPGPLGVSLGHGMLAGTKSLDNQRKELQSEQSVNQKAQALYQTAKAELDKYTKMAPYDRAYLQLQNKQLEQSNVPGATKLARAMTVKDAWNMLKDNSDFVSMTPQQREAAATQLAERVNARAAAAQAAGNVAAPAPATPAGPPPGAKFSPSTNKWWTADGKSYQFDKDGKAY